MVLTGGASAVDPEISTDVTDKVSQLENINDGWSTMPELNKPRFAHGCGVIKDGDKQRIVIAGGKGSDLAELNSVEVYEVGGLLFPPWIEGDCLTLLNAFYHDCELVIRYPPPHGILQGK